MPNHLWEDQNYDPHELRVAGWLSSHADGYVEEHVSRNEIARRTGVSAGKVTSALAKLQELGVVSVETVQVSQSEGGKRLVITFDFDVWEGGQSDWFHNRARSSHDQAPVTTRPDPGHQVTTSVHAIEEQEETTSSSVDDGVPQFDRNFEEFWKLYPHKVGKPAARKALLKLWREFAANEGDYAIAPAVIAQGLSKWIAFWEREKTPAKFIPYPATWLNRRGWEDQPAPEQPKDESVPVLTTVPVDILKAWNEIEPWVRAQGERGLLLCDNKARVLGALVTLRRWNYGLGESLVRLACAMRYAPDYAGCWDPKYLGGDGHRVTRFSTMPQDYQQDRAMTLVACMQRAYDNQRWGK